MRSVLVISALSGLAIAAPRPQSFNLGAVQELKLPEVLGPEPADVPEATPTYNPESAAKSAAAEIPTDPVSVDKRGLKRGLKRSNGCEPENGGEGPLPGDGSVEAYLAEDSILAQAANSAGTPSGYVKSFTNLQGSTQQIGYLTYKNLGSEYDVEGCASFCASVEFCLGFNIFFERDPSVKPGAGCANPPPITNIKCSLYGYPVAKDSATNMGQWRGPEDANGEAFHVVIAGSNGYSRKNPVPSPGGEEHFTGPSPLLTGAINAPLDNGKDTYLGMKLYNEGPYDPSLCAAACQAQTAYDRATAGEDGSYKPCNFFNSYILAKNDVPLGTYCSFYTRVWDESYAVNTGYYHGSDVYSVVGSFTYELTDKDAGQI